MKSHLTICAIAVLALALPTQAASKDDVLAAAKKLADAPNYSWKTTVTVPEGSQFRPGPSEGKAEKGGYTCIQSSFGDNTVQTVLKGDKGAVTNQDGDWESLSDLEQEQGGGRFRAMMARSFKAPAVQAQDLASGAKELSKEGDAYSGELSEDAAKSLLSFGRRGGGGANVSNAKGSVKFWLKDGSLAKYQFHVTGTVTFNNNDREIDRTTTVEIKDVGSTKVEVPEAAKKKVS